MEHTWLVVVLAGVLIGSFLNVVIIRLPRQLYRLWQQQSDEFYSLDLSLDDRPYSLISPRSQCYHCRVNIKCYDNIPIVSYLCLGGKCRNCHNKISWQYPLVELITALLCLSVLYRYGPTLQTVMGCCLVASLVAQAWIDGQHYLIPDQITLPMLWLGLLLSVFNVFASPPQAIIGAAVGYLSFWSFNFVFKIITKKDGMGHGDFKLMAMLGAWLGWQYILQIIIIACMLGIVWAALLYMQGKMQKYKPVPFGPAISIAGWIALLFGDKINQFYWQLSEFSY